MNLMKEKENVKLLGQFLEFIINALVIFMNYFIKKNKLVENFMNGV